MKRMATQRNNWDRNRSSSKLAGLVPWAPWPLITGSPKLNVEANNPNGNAPIPNDIWKPPSKPKLENAPLFSGSVLCPWGRGGSFSLGSCLEPPLPYNGMTLSRLIAALQTGHDCLFGLVSSHWWRHGQQKRWPHMLMTASFAVSRQILHSKALSSSALSSFFFSSLFSPPSVLLGLDEVSASSSNAISKVNLRNKDTIIQLGYRSPRYWFHLN